MRRNQEVLLMRRQGSGYYDGWYSLPAGHVDPGELPKSALVREAKEELGIRVREDSLKLIHTLYRTKSDATGDRVDIFFDGQWDGQPTIQEHQKCDDLHWFNQKKLPVNTIPYVRYVLQMVHENINYSELDAITLASLQK